MQRRFSFWHAAAVGSARSIAACFALLASSAWADPVTHTATPTNSPCTAKAERAVADPVIQFWQAKVQASPLDAALAVRLANAYLERAKLTHDHRLYQGAEGAVKASLRRVPDYLPAQLALGSSLLAQHRFGEARQLAEQALRRHPGDASARALRGDARLGLHELAGARLDYAKLVADTPGLLSHARMANLQMAEGNAAAALTSLEQGLTLAGARADPPALLGWGLVRLGETRFRTGDWQGAAQAYAKAIEIAGNEDPDLLDHLAELHAAKGELPQALDYSARALAIAPRPEFKQSRGDIYGLGGDAANARACYQQARDAYLAAAEAGHGHYYHHLAGLYSDTEALRDPLAALKWANKDVQLRRTPATLDAVAWALYQGGKFAESASQMDAALQHKSADGHLLYHASLIYARAGNNAKSRKYLAAAAMANPKFSAFHFHR